VAQKARELTTSAPVAGDGQLSVSTENAEHAGQPYTVVRLAGWADGEAARQQLRETLAARAHHGPRALVVELSQLESIDFRTLRELVKVNHLVNGLGGTLSLACPQPDVARLLLLAGIDQLIPLFGTAEEAVTR
jgi:anti-anti-sigma factor